MTKILNAVRGDGGGRPVPMPAEVSDATRVQLPRASDVLPTASQMLGIAPPTSAPKPGPKKSEPKWVDRFAWYRPDVMFAPTRPFLDEFLKRSGQPLFHPDEITKMLALEDRLADIQAKMREVNFDAARTQCNAIHATNARKIAAGEPPDPVPELERLKEQHEHERQHLREHLRSIRNATRFLMQAVCSRLANAGRKVCEDLQAEEMERAKQWGQQFVPSGALACMVWLCDRGLAQQAENTSGPDFFLFGQYHRSDLK